MTLNGVMALFCVISSNSGSFRRTRKSSRSLSHLLMSSCIGATYKSFTYLLSYLSNANIANRNGTCLRLKLVSQTDRIITVHTAHEYTLHLACSNKSCRHINLTAELDLSNVGGSVDDKHLHCSAAFLESELTPTKPRTRAAKK